MADSPEERVPLTPNHHQKRRGAANAATANAPTIAMKKTYPSASPTTGWSSAMAMFSPPPPPARQKSPFHETTVNRMAKTPTFDYHVHRNQQQQQQRVNNYSNDNNHNHTSPFSATTARTQTIRIQTMKEEDDDDHEDDDDDEPGVFTLPWLQQQQQQQLQLQQLQRVESLIGSEASRPYCESPRSHASSAPKEYSSSPSPRGRYPRRNSHDASSIAEASVASSCLFGEAMLSPSEASLESIHLASPSPNKPKKKSVSFLDLESGLSLQQQQQQRRPNLVKEWSRHLNQELNRVGTITSNELLHIAKLSTQTATRTAQRVLDLRPAPLSPLPEELYDLEYLQQTHKEKIGRLANVHHDDQYEFALVLAPQEVYGFWAEHLDFRAEQLGDVPSAVSPTSTQGTTDSQDEEPTIDARPFLTPLTGMRQRRKTTPSPFTPASKRHVFSGGLGNQSFALDDSLPRVVKSRLSLFEKAIGVFSPRMSSAGGSSRKNIFSEESPTTPPTSVLTARRRWGNRGFTGGTSTPGDLSSPPIRSLGRVSSVRKRASVALSTLTSRTTPTAADDDDDLELPSSKRLKKNPNSINAEDIPTQIIPRGIAARTNGMLQFLSALKRGIVVRRHRPGAEAFFVKILSADGGDTIKYEYIESDEAMMAFKEQKVRYNKKISKHVDLSRSLSKAWIDGDDHPHFSIPDFVAAQQNRKRDQAGLQKTVADAATKVKNSGMIKASDIIAVHAGRHPDPRSSTGALGVGSLRKSKSEYHGPHSFSIILRGPQAMFQKQKMSNASASEKWYSGSGRDIEFKSVDFEAATEGEYWLIFRGFLLLHRDVASGRFAAQRAAGFGSNYNRREVDRMKQEDESERYNILQKDVYHEPPTLGWIEKLANKVRKIETPVGYAEAGAVPPPSDYFLGFKSPGTQIWSRLRQAGLETSRVYALDTRRVLIKVRCPDDRLLDVAEVLRIQLKTRNGSFAPFRENAIAQFQPLNEEKDKFKGMSEGASLFRSSQRQTVIDFIIRSRIRDSGAELGQSTELGNFIQSRVPLHVHSKLDSLYNGWFYFWRRSNWEGRDGCSMTVDASVKRETRQIDFADSDETQPLDGSIDPPNVFHRFFVGALHQPLDSIETYFGEKIAFYFAWLQHCACHLVFLSIAGAIVTMCQLSSGKWDHSIRPYFSVVVMMWSFLVLINWKKRSNFLAYRWGTKNHKEKETTRPQYHGDYVRDEITQEWVVIYPSWKRYLKYLISFPLTLLFTVGTLVVILLVHANRDLMLANYFHEKTNGSEQFHISFSIKAIGQKAPLEAVHVSSEHLRDPIFWVITAGLPAALGLCLPLLNLILMRISVALNNFENYRTESEYRNHLIIKVFSFRFVCYFATLYYYSFMSIGSEQEIESGILRVGTSVFIYITVTHWWGLFLQIQFPVLIHRWRMRRLKKRLREELMMVEMEEVHYAGMSQDEAMDEEMRDRHVQLINKRLLLDQAQDELWREVMLPMHDSFPEYIQAIVQFAYVTCFSVVLPITPIVCLMNHILSMRFDAYKVCRTRNRPLAIKTGGIGVWEHVLHIVSVIAVLTNCFLMGFTNSQLRWIGDQIGNLGLFCIVVGWEHVMLLIKYIMTASISTLPRAVKDEMKREHHKMERMQSSNMRAKNDRRTKHSRQGSQASVIRNDTDCDSHLSSVGPTHQGNVHPRASQGGGLCTIPSEDTENCSTGSGNQKQCQDGSKATGSTESKKSTPGRVPFQRMTDNTGSPSNESRFAAPTPCHLQMDAEATTAHSKEADEKPGNSPFSMFLPVVSVQTPSAAQLTPRNSIESFFGGRGLDEDESLATREASISSLVRGGRNSDLEEAEAAARITSRLQSLESRIRANESQQEMPKEVL